MEAIIKVFRNTKESGICGIYSKITQDEAINKLEHFEKEYQVIEKRDKIDLELVLS